MRDVVSRSILSFHLRRYLCEVKVAPPDRCLPCHTSKLTKSAIDAIPTPKADVVYWDAAVPALGVKVTPKGRKVFIVLYRTGGAGSRLRKYTIGSYGA